MTLSIIPRVLLVDDVTANRLVVKAALGKLEMEIVEAVNGKDALEKSLQGDYALVLLDVQMPDMNGFEVAEYLRSIKRTQKTPIIFLTAINKDDKYVFKGYETGAVDYLIKPFEPEVLKSKVSIFLELEKNRLEQEAIKEELEYQKARTEEKSNDFQAFATRVAHDLKSPLGVISTFSQMLKSGDAAPDEYQQFFERIEYNAKLSFKFIDGIYSLAALNTQEKIQKEEVILQPHIVQLLEENQEDFDKHGVEVKIDCPHPVHLSTNQLPIIIRNLVSNAMKFKKEGQPQKITIFTENTPNHICLHIEDNGPGIAEKARRKIFYAMERLVGSDIPGLGLGLSMVKRVMELHGGKIHAEDAKQLKGAAFLLNFPKERPL